MNIENNKIIAEFMGATFKENEFRFPTIVFKTGKNYFENHELKFHSDWNWLMEVVEKIESILPDDSIVTIEYKDCYIPVLEDEEPFTIEGNGETKIQAVYNACLEFIKWYNLQNS